MGRKSNVKAGRRSGGMRAVQSAVEQSDFWERAKSNAYLGAEKLMQSPTFVSGVKEAIGKQAFMMDYDITQKQVDSLSSKMIKSLAGNAKSGNKTVKTESAQDYAKRYFREHYNPNKEPREITSSTYKRAQNRLQSNVEAFLGTSKKKK